MDSHLTAKAVAKFLAYFDQVKQIHLTTLGRPLEMYKATEPVCLEEKFRALASVETRGGEFVADVVHELVWGQCLGNANHRTTILFVRTFLESANVQFPHYATSTDAEPRFEASVNEWTGRSQALIRRRGEPGYAQASLAPRHREIAGAWVTEMLGPQSEVLTRIGPQRLMDFIS